MPPAPILSGVPCMAAPPPPMPDMRTQQAPIQAESPPLHQLNAVLGNTAACSEAELAELAAWVGTTPPGLQAGPPAIAPRMLPCGAIGQSVPPAPQQLPQPSPVLTVYSDESALAAPAAAPAITNTVPTQAPAAPPPMRPHVLADMTNRHAAGPPASEAKTLRTISSKLHVAASKKIQPLVGA